jgi:hypothetical protein
MPRHEWHKNPATRTFQALRIAVNHELEQIERLLDQLADCLRPGGRLCIIAFHSLEDRIVKRRLRALAGRAGTGTPARVRLLNKHVVVAGDAERERNPRSRSAKLRAAERIALALATAGALVHVGVRMKGIEVAYDLGRERKLNTELEEQRRRLHIEIGMLKDPVRVVALARDKLKMGPPLAGDL